MYKQMYSQMFEIVLLALRRKIAGKASPSGKAMFGRQGFAALVTNARVSAFSITELTVGMVILTLVSSAALLLYLQLTRSSVTLTQQRWRLYLAHYAFETKQKASYYDEHLTLAEGIVEKKITHYQDQPELIGLQLSFTPTQRQESAATFLPSYLSQGEELKASPKQLLHHEIIYLPRK